MLVTIIATGCVKSEPVITSEVYLSESITESKNSINVVVDPRLEILSIVQFLSNYKESFPNEITNFEFEYKDKIEEHFGDFIDHKAVKAYEKKLPNFSYSIPPELILYMNDDFTLMDDAKIPDRLVYLFRGRKNINGFFFCFREFCIDTDFNKFFTDNRTYYEEIIQATIDLIPYENNIVKNLEEYYGMSKISYNVAIVSLYGFTAYGPSFDRLEGEEIYNILGSMMVDYSGIPLFSTKSRFKYLTEHEFSHSFINPITDSNLDLAYKYEKLYGPARERMSNMPYENWYDILNEHIIRALTSRFTYNENDLDGLRALREEREQGFIYIDDFFHKLDEYENNRDKYPTIEDFYPQLLQSLDPLL